MQGNSSKAADRVASPGVQHRGACGSTRKSKVTRVLPRHSAAHNRVGLSKIVRRPTGDRLGLERPQGSP
jgi:hypothetical protein